MNQSPSYPHIRFTSTVAGTAAGAFPRATSPDSDWLGFVYLSKDTAAQRRAAEKELRKMFPAR